MIYIFPFAVIRAFTEFILLITLMGITLFAIANLAALVATSSPIALNLLPIPPRLSLTGLFTIYSYPLQMKIPQSIQGIVGAIQTALFFIPLPIMHGLFSFAPTTVAVLYLPALVLIWTPHITLIAIDYSRRSINANKLRMLYSYFRYIKIPLLSALLIAFAPTLVPILTIPLFLEIYLNISSIMGISTSSDFTKLLSSTLQLSTSFTHIFITCVLISSLIPLLTPTIPTLAPLLPLITASSSFVAQFNPLIFAATFTLITETLYLMEDKYRAPLYRFFSSLQSLTQTTVHSLYTHKIDPELTEVFKQKKSASDGSDTLGSDTSKNPRASCQSFFDDDAKIYTATKK